MTIFLTGSPPISLSHRPPITMLRGSDVTVQLEDCDVTHGGASLCVSSNNRAVAMTTAASENLNSLKERGRTGAEEMEFVPLSVCPGPAAPRDRLVRGSQQRRKQRPPSLDTPDGTRPALIDPLEGEKALSCEPQGTAETPAGGAVAYRGLHARGPAKGVEGADGGPRQSLLGRPISLYRPNKRDVHYRRLQARIYNFLERPKDYRAISYHLLV